MQIKKGQIIIITTGDYSDYGLRDYLRALKRFDTDKEIRRFKDTGDYLAPHEWDPEGEPNEYGSDERFLAWAIQEGLVAPVKTGHVTEWHIGTYGHLS